MQRNVNDWERVASVAAGAVLAWSAWHGARGRKASAVTALGAAALAARGITGYCPVNAAIGRGRHRDDTRDALGGVRGIFIRERIGIRAPIETLFSFWRNPSNLPRVIPFLRRVDRIDSIRSHWVLDGPAGTTLEWDAEVINIVPFETIAWRSLAGADVANAGSVNFRESLDEVTDVVVTMQYDPPAGKVGAALAGLLGGAGAARVREALVEFKAAMEGDLLPVARSSRYPAPAIG
jgi:uncharacterized membrane protein